MSVSEKQLLTIKEQEFYAFVRKYRGKMPKQVEIAQKLNIDRQRVHQLISRLKEKGWM
jgi:DNA-binding MarR family transcriptional regulator